MTISGEDISRVTNLLKLRPRGMSIAAIAKELHMNRNSVAKYLDLLTASGAVELTRVGPAKLYFTAPRVPVSGMINLSSDYFIMLDANLRVLYVNNNVLAFEGRTRPEVLQKKLDDLSFALVADDEIRKYLHSAERDEIFQREVEVRKGEETFHFRVKIISTVYENGTQGTTILASDITTETEQKKALQASEAEYRGVVEDQTELIFRFRPDRIFTFTNDAFLRVVGKRREEVVGVPATFPVLEEDMVKIRQAYGSLSMDQPITSLQHRVTHADGTIHWMQVNFRAFFDESGNPWEYQAVARDITDLKAAEEAIRKSEARYRAVVESQQEGIIRFTPEGIFTFVNDAFCRFVGRTPEEIVGSNVTYFVTDEDMARIRMMYRALTPEHPTTIIEFRARRLDGAVRWIQGDFQAFFDDRGAPVEYQSVSRDITDLKAAERRIQESEAQYRAVVEDQEEGIARFKPDGKFTFANDFFCWFVGRPREQIVGSDVTHILPDQDLARIRDVYRSLTPARSSAILEFQAKRSDGTVRWIQASFRGLFNDRGEPMEYQVVGRDVTDLKAAERRIQESEARYRAVVEDQTEWIVRFRPDGIFTFANDAFCRNLGKRREEIVGLPFTLPLSDEEYARTRTAYRSLTPAHPSTSLETQVTNHDGRYRIIEVTFRGLFDERGEPTEYQAVGRDVTDRRCAEDLARVEFDSFPVPSYILRKKRDDLVLTDYNEAAFRDTDGKIPTQIGRTARELWRDYPSVLVNLERCLAEKTTLEEELHYTFHTTGRVRDLILRYAYLPPDGVLAYTLDITDRKMMEKALRASEEQFREMAETSPFPITIINGDGRYRYVNRKFTEVFGYTLDDVPIGKRWFEQAFPDQNLRREAISTWKGDLAGSRPGMVRPRQFPVQCRNGECREVIFRPVTLRDGTQYITYEDVTERLTTLDSLRQSEARFKHLFNSMRCCFTLLEPVVDEKGIPVDLTFREVNTAMERLSGRIREDLLGQQLREMYPHTPQELIEAIGRVALTGDPKKLVVYHPDFDRTLKIRAYSPWKGQCALIFRVMGPQETGIPPAG